MQLINTISVCHQGSERFVRLYIGDLAQLPQPEAVDLLVVSAFPDDYTPTRTSLIGSLARAGVSVAELAKNKEVDLRQFSSCWLSRPIARSDMHYHRILCFEPLCRGQAAEVVGDIFRSIVPFTTGSPPISQIAMPLVASGDQGESAELMLEALVDAAVHWLSIGLPLKCIKIVIRNSADSMSIRETFASVKRRHAEATTVPRPPTFQFDVFVSYSQKNKVAVDLLVHELIARRPELRIFVDRIELSPGAAWQQRIFESLDESRKVICAFSPEYLTSKVCKEEYNIALFRHREAADGVLLPVYLYTAMLPTYMKLVNYEDVREADTKKIARAAEMLLKQI